LHANPVAKGNIVNNKKRLKKTRKVAEHRAAPGSKPSPTERKFVEKTETESPLQEVDPTMTDDSVRESITRELKEAAYSGERSVRKAAQTINQNLSETARAGSRLFSTDSARQVAGLFIDAGAEIGDRIVRLEERMAEVTKGTPIAPVFRVQAGISKRIFQGSTKLARTIWGLASEHQEHKA
jgi:hypothetical protein